MLYDSIENKLIGLSLGYPRNSIRKTNEFIFATSYANTPLPK